jgi:hypothetical protein
MVKVRQPRRDDDEEEPVRNNSLNIILTLAGGAGLLLMACIGTAIYFMNKPKPAPAPVAVPAAVPAAPVRAEAPPGFAWLEDNDFSFRVVVPAGFVKAPAPAPKDGRAVGYLAQHPATACNIKISAYQFPKLNPIERPGFERFLLLYEGLKDPTANAPAKLAGIDGYEFNYASTVSLGNLKDLMKEPAADLAPGADPFDDLKKLEESLKGQKEKLEGIQDAVAGAVGGAKRTAVRVRVIVGPDNIIYCLRADRPDDYPWTVATGSFARTK